MPEIKVTSNFCHQLSSAKTDYDTIEGERTRLIHKGVIHVIVTILCLYTRVNHGLNFVIQDFCFPYDMQFNNLVNFVPYLF